MQSSYIDNSFGDSNMKTYEDIDAAATRITNRLNRSPPRQVREPINQSLRSRVRSPRSLNVGTRAIQNENVRGAEGPTLAGRSILQKRRFDEPTLQNRDVETRQDRINTLRQRNVEAPRNLPANGGSIPNTLINNRRNVQNDFMNNQRHIQNDERLIQNDFINNQRHLQNDERLLQNDERLLQNDFMNNQRNLQNDERLLQNDLNDRRNRQPGLNNQRNRQNDFPINQRNRQNDHRPLRTMQPRTLRRDLQNVSSRNVSSRNIGIENPPLAGARGPSLTGVRSRNLQDMDTDDEFTNFNDLSISQTDDELNDLQEDLIESRTQRLNRTLQRKHILDNLSQSRSPARSFERKSTKEFDTNDRYVSGLTKSRNLAYEPEAERISKLTELEMVDNIIEPKVVTQSTIYQTKIKNAAKQSDRDAELFLVIKKKRLTLSRTGQS